MKDVATILEDAADLLLINGRCTGMGHDEDGRLCVLGAIGEAIGGQPWNAHAVASHPATLALALHLHPDKEPVFKASSMSLEWAVFSWNDCGDANGRPDDFEVIDTLRRVAKDLRNGENP